jgi:hypothetical protein
MDQMMTMMTIKERRKRNRNRAETDRGAGSGESVFLFFGNTVIPSFDQQPSVRQQLAGDDEPGGGTAPREWLMRWSAAGIPWQ